MHRRGLIKFLLIFMVVVLIVGGTAALYGYTLTKVSATAPTFNKIERISATQARVTGQLSIVNQGPMSVHVGGIPFKLVGQDTNKTVVNGTIPAFTVKSGENKTIVFNATISKSDIASVSKAKFEATVELQPFRLFTIPIPIESSFDVTGIANALLPEWVPKV